MSRPTLGQRLDLLLESAPLRRFATCVVLLGAGVTAGALVPPPYAARAEVQVQPPPPAFQSGDQLAVPILRGIADTLNRIDGRMARLEAVFKELTKPRPSQAAAE